MMATGGFSFKKKKKLIDSNTVDISIKETKTVTWPWFAGGIAIVGGIVVLLLVNSKKNSAAAQSSVLAD